MPTPDEIKRRAEAEINRDEFRRALWDLAQINAEYEQRTNQAS